MPQSLARILVHTVFSTRDRRPSLRDTALPKELHHYPGGILKCGIDCREGRQTIQPFQGNGAYLSSFCLTKRLKSPMILALEGLM